MEISLKKALKKEYDRKWYLKNREEWISKTCEWQKLNPEKSHAIRTKYRKANPIKEYLRSLKDSAKRKNISCTLTIYHIMLKLMTAHITIEQVGKNSGEYQLGRYGDVGGYTPENCRFITIEQNLKEKGGK